jgi:NADH-quinone oxidoreductase subunit L
MVMLLLIPLLPFVGFLINAFLGRRLSKSISGGIACLAIIGSFVVSVISILSPPSTGCRRATCRFRSGSGWITWRR